MSDAVPTLYWSSDLEAWTNQWIEQRFPGGVDAFRAVRNLIGKISEIHPTDGWQALKFVSKLQWFLKKVYPPDLNPRDGQLLRPDVDHHLLSEMTRYWLFSAVMYPAGVLKSQNISCKDDIEATLLSWFPGEVEVVLIQKNTESGCPAHGVFADHTKKEIVISIRGSAEVADWVIDFVCHPTQSGNHAGMEEASKLLDSRLRGQITTFLCTHKDYRLTLCGHSLGGGVASLLAIRWNEQQPLRVATKLRPRARAWAFGPPCVVSAHQAFQAKDYVTSVAFGRDFVTHFYHDAVHTSLLRLRLLAQLISRESEDVLSRYQFDIDEDCISGGCIDLTSGRRSAENITLVLPMTFAHLQKLLCESTEKVVKANAMRRNYVQNRSPSFNNLLSALLTRLSPPWAAAKTPPTPPTAPATPPTGPDAEYWSACEDSPPNLDEVDTTPFSGLEECALDRGVSFQEEIDPHVIAVLEKTYDAIMSHRCEENAFYAAGRYFLIIPESHLRQYNISPPSQAFAHNKCFFWELLDESKIMEQCVEIPLTLESFTDHLCAKYAFALAPDSLLKVPRELTMV